jgi:hypothetical protein
LGSFAETETSLLTDCEQLAADAERLKCYDKIANVQSERAPQADTREAGWWIILASIDIGRDNNITKESLQKIARRRAGGSKMWISDLQ